MPFKDCFCCFGFFKTKSKDDKKNSEGTPLVAAAKKANGTTPIDPNLLTRITPLTGSPASQTSRSKTGPWNDFTPPLDGAVNPRGVGGDRSERSYTH